MLEPLYPAHLLPLVDQRQLGQRQGQLTTERRPRARCAKQRCSVGIGRAFDSFETHAECPVSGCSCKCSSLDWTVEAITAERERVATEEIS